MFLDSTDVATPTFLSRAMVRPRDSQRSKVYAIRDFGSDIPNPRFDVLVPDLQNEVNRIMRSAYLDRRYGSRRIALWVEDGRGRRSACADIHGGVLKFPRWSRDQLTICHEIAHVLTHVKYGRNAAWHGWEFCSTLLDVVHSARGAEAEQALKSRFREGKVRFSQPRKRQPMSEEQKEAARSRLAQARAKRAASQEKSI